MENAFISEWVRPERVQALMALRVVQNEKVIRGLVRALGDPNWEVRRAAAEGLLAAGDLVVVPLLEELAHGGGGAHFVEGARRLLESVRYAPLRRALRPLLEALDDPGACSVLALEAGEVLDRVRHETGQGVDILAANLAGALLQGR